MKKFCFFLLCSLTLVICKAQKTSNPLVGHYYSCSNEGYGEFLITDSVTRYISEMPLMMSLPYEIINEKELVRLGDDTIEYTILSEDQIFLKKDHYWEDTLTRFKEDIPNIYDYNCEMRISNRAFDEILWLQYESRKLLHGRGCLPIDLDFFWTDSVGTYGLDSLLTDSFSSEGERLPKTKILQYGTRVLSEMNASLQKLKLYNITYDFDNTQALIEIDDYNYCYEHYEFIAVKLLNNRLEFRGLFPSEKMAKCFEKCHLRHYILLEIDEKIDFNEIFINRRPVKIE